MSWTRLLQPTWLLRHLAAAGAAYGCERLGLWQLTRAHATHSVQNYGYSFQWWTFGVVGTVWYLKVLLDAVRPDVDAAGVPVREKVRSTPVFGRGPARTVDDADDDPQLAAYNRYLASLSEQ